MTGARVYRGGELIADRVVADIEIPLAERDQRRVVTATRSVPDQPRKSAAARLVDLLAELPQLELELLNIRDQCEKDLAGLLEERQQADDHFGDRRLPFERRKGAVPAARLGGGDPVDGAADGVEGGGEHARVGGGLHVWSPHVLAAVRLGAAALVEAGAALLSRRRTKDSPPPARR